MIQSSNQAEYFVETAKGTIRFVTDRLHTQFNKLEDFLKAHEKTIGFGIQIYSVYKTHNGQKVKLG